MNNPLRPNNFRLETAAEYGDLRRYFIEHRDTLATCADLANCFRGWLRQNALRTWSSRREAGYPVHFSNSPLDRALYPINGMPIVRRPEGYPATPVTDLMDEVPF